MRLEEMCDNDLVEEWKSFNDILTDCPESQSDYDINMRNALEEEIVSRGGEFEMGARTHVFKGFRVIERLQAIPLSPMQSTDLEQPFIM